MFNSFSPAAKFSKPPPAASATWPSPACSGQTAARGDRRSSIRWPPKKPHFTPRAKRVIFMFMQGGPSHVDTFDYKPALERDDGKSPGGGRRPRATAS